MIKTIDKVWDEGDVNCSCFESEATFTRTKSKTNTHKVEVNGSFSFTFGTTAGVDLASLVKAEATTEASWTVSLGYGYEATSEESLEASVTSKAMKCSEWSYHKWYWTGTVNGTADLKTSFQDNVQCMGPTSMLNHMGERTYADAIKASGRGWVYYDGDYGNPGVGFQNWDVRCSKCNTNTYCYKYECPDDCGSCD